MLVFKMHLGINDISGVGLRGRGVRVGGGDGQGVLVERSRVGKGIWGGGGGWWCMATASK